MNEQSDGKHCESRKNKDKESLICIIKWTKIINWNVIYFNQLKIPAPNGYVKLKNSHTIRSKPLKLYKCMTYQQYGQGHAPKVLIN